jgi:hypothetical protein
MVLLQIMAAKCGNILDSINSASRWIYIITYHHFMKTAYFEECRISFFILKPFKTDQVGSAKLLLAFVSSQSLFRGPV